MKLGLIIDENFHILLNKLASEPLPLKTAFKIKGIIKKVREEYERYDEVRQQALKNYGMKNEDGTLKVDEANNVQFDLEGRISFAKEMSELTSLEIEVPQIKLSELGDKLNISVAELSMLDGILVED